MSQLRKSSSAASQSSQQLADDESFAGSSRCPFRAHFHAGFCLAFESTRMLAHQQPLLALLSSQPVHVKRDPVRESRDSVFIRRFVGTSRVKSAD